MITYNRQTTWYETLATLRRHVVVPTPLSWVWWCCMERIGQEFLSSSARDRGETSDAEVASQLVNSQSCDAATYAFGRERGEERDYLDHNYVQAFKTDLNHFCFPKRGGLELTILVELVKHPSLSLACRPTYYDLECKLERKKINKTKKSHKTQISLFLSLMEGAAVQRVWFHVSSYNYNFWCG